MDIEGDYVKALHIQAGRVVQRFRSEEEAKVTLPGIQTLSFPGKTILPGFIDSHMHLLSLGRSLEEVDARGVRSVEGLVKRVRERVEVHEPGTWITGAGWDQGCFTDQRYPTRDDLDLASTEHPITIWRACRHILVANSLALEQMGVNSSTPNPPGGVIDKDPTGRPTGVLREKAAEATVSFLPSPSLEDKKRWARSGLKELARNGITSVQTNDSDARQVYSDLRNEMELSCRVYLSPLFEEALALSEMGGITTGMGDDLFRMGRAKLFADGSLGAKTAALREPYQGDSTTGVMIYPPEELESKILAADTAGWQVETHAIGDRAAEVVLEAYDKMEDTSGKRPVLTHCQVLGPDLVDKMSRSGVVGAIQPIFLTTDMLWAEQYLGSKRMSYAYAWKTLANAGVICASSSDSPIEPVNPLSGIFAAVERKNLGGEPVDGWFPNECLSVWEAVRSYTVNGAYAEFQEKNKGRLLEGFLADMVVLDNDPFTTPSLLFIKVVATILGGKVVHQA